jgi:purine-binding chemotaxis protein CheW
VLVVRSQKWLCAIPVRDVIETYRPVPVQRIAGVPAYVRGLAVVRGQAVPVVSLSALLNGKVMSRGSRFVSLRVKDRIIALEVDQVLGVRPLNQALLNASSPLIFEANAELFKTLGSLDGELFALLDSTRILRGELLQTLLDLVEW